MSVSVIGDYDLDELTIDQLNAMEDKINGATMAYNHTIAVAQQTVIDLQREIVQIWNEKDRRKFAAKGIKK